MIAKLEKKIKDIISGMIAKLEKKIKDIISDMIAKLEKKAKADATKKTYCDKELAGTNSKKADKSVEIAGLPQSCITIVIREWIDDDVCKRGRS